MAGRGTGGTRADLLSKRACCKTPTAGTPARGRKAHLTPDMAAAAATLPLEYLLARGRAALLRRLKTPATRSHRAAGTLPPR